MRDAQVIVVVEDEAVVRMLAVDALKEEGYRVFEVAHAEGAIQYLEEHADDVRGLFTDHHLAGQLTGLDLAHHTDRHWPWIAILLASGIARPDPHVLPRRTRFLRKPYEIAEVIGHLQEMIALD
jgi:CheY-like chemotaxis protein